MLRLAALLNNKATDTPASPNGEDRIAAIRAAREQLQAQLREIRAGIQQAQEAGDFARAAEIRAQRTPIEQELAGLNEDESHLVRRQLQEKHASELEALNRERVEIIAQLEERGAEMEAHARVGAQVWQAYTETWDRYQAWNRKRESAIARLGTGPDFVDPYTTLGIPHSLLYRTGQMAATARRVDNDRLRETAWRGNASVPVPAPSARQQKTRIVGRFRQSDLRS